MKLKFIRDVLVYAEHRAQGSIHEISEPDATLLIADGCAVAVAPAPVIETAESRVMQAAENTTIPTAKGRKARK